MIPTELSHDIIKAWINGETAASLAEQTGCCERTIGRFIKKHGASRKDVRSVRHRARTKVCTACHKKKKVASFAPAINYVGGRRSRCRMCIRLEQAAYNAKNKEKQAADTKARRIKNARSELASYLKREYGFTIDLYEAMLSDQNEVCAICRGSPIGNKKRLSVDHCHASGIVRGLLCDQCNQGLGCFSDKEDSLMAASIYLKQPPTDIKFSTSDKPARSRVRSELLEAQSSVCAICKKQKRRLVLDHCHDTGLVRGVLCDACNTGIGCFKNNPLALQAASRYIRMAEQATSVSPSRRPD